MSLSVLATFPELKGWETRYGSLLRGAKAAVSAAGEEKGHKPMFATLWGGLSTLVNRLIDSIGPERVRLGQPVEEIERDGGDFSIRLGNGEAQPTRASAVILATPAVEAARLLEGLDPAASNELGQIAYASTAVVFLAYPPGTASRIPQGTGLVVPTGEGTMTACTWVSRKWPRKEFGDRAVLRCFIGRVGAEQALDLCDEDLISVVAREVERMTPIGAEPSASRVVRWDRSMPQYGVGHLERVDRIEASLAAAPGVFVTGSAYRGVGIPDCIKQGREASDRVLHYIYQHERAMVVEPHQEAAWKS